MGSKRKPPKFMGTIFSLSTIYYWTAELTRGCTSIVEDRPVRPITVTTTEIFGNSDKIINSRLVKEGRDAEIVGIPFGQMKEESLR